MWTNLIIYWSVQISYISERIIKSKCCNAAWNFLRLQSTFGSSWWCRAKVSYTNMGFLKPKCCWIFDEMSYSNKMDLFQYFKVGLWNYIDTLFLSMFMFFLDLQTFIRFYFATEMSFYTRLLILNQKKINCNNYEFGIFAVHKK